MGPIRICHRSFLPKVSLRLLPSAPGSLDAPPGCQNGDTRSPNDKFDALKITVSVSKMTAIGKKCSENKQPETSEPTRISAGKLNKKSTGTKHRKTNKPAAKGPAAWAKPWCPFRPLSGTRPRGLLHLQTGGGCVSAPKCVRCILLTHTGGGPSGL